MTSSPPLPAPRTVAYLLLWGVLGAVIWWRGVPPAEVRFVAGNGDEAPFRIDLNRDGWEALVLLPGIGESLARRIEAARAERGGFGSLDEVLALPGIPDRPFEEALPWLVLDGRPVTDEPAARER